MPHAAALTFGGRTVTYEGLNRRANQLAHRLRTLGVGPDVLVGVHLERSPELVIGDSRDPQGRRRLRAARSRATRTIGSGFMIEDARLPLVVTSRALAGERSRLGTAAVVCLDGHGGRAGRQPAAEPSRPDNLAYVIYTSGSTGKPKGVLITHANVSRLFDATETWFQFGARRRLDAVPLVRLRLLGLGDLGRAALRRPAGRRAVLGQPRTRTRSIELLVRERVTVLNQTPSAFRQLIQADGERRDAGARSRSGPSCFGGEALDAVEPAPVVRAPRRRSARSWSTCTASPRRRST